MTQTLRFLRLLAITTMGLAAIGACQERKPAPADTTAGQTTAPVGPAIPPTVSDVVALARNYSFDGDSEPVPAKGKIKADGNNRPIPKSDDPKMTIAMASWSSSSTPPGDRQILARVTARRAYPGLGVMPHANYIWRAKMDPTDSKTWRVWMVPETGGMPVELKRDDHNYSETDAESMKRPRLVYETSIAQATKTDMIVFGVCLEDPVLCGGHCGYSQ